ncbi:hypothetical protein MQX03_06385 [Chryseobacterium aahli]|uniref:glycosyltransferase n=1 Tax=Chryseobacterium aahli TaxID=1278643 RepID=UPI001F6232EC|nr:hypothetical protein [Chryseobacterium aahli]MCI3936819.1 hypothetical protein [Chryseobacterium aahli]
MEAIFSKFKKEELAQLYFVEIDVDRDFAEANFYVSDKDVVKSMYGAKIENKYSLTKSLNDNSQNFGESKIVQFLRNHNQTFALFRDLLWQTFRLEKKDSLLSWIKDFNPNFIFFVGGYQASTHRMVRFLSNRFQVKYGIFYTDDYIIYPNQDNILKKIQHGRLKRSYAKTIKDASICFAIGDMMAEEYSKYFNKTFQPIMNMVRTDLPIIKITNNEKFVISYFGGLHLNRWRMLAGFSSQLDQKSIILRVYANDVLKEDVARIFEETNIDFKGCVTGEGLKNAIADSDALIHVESDLLEYRSLTKLSVSTKIPEYLNTNKLVIAYGPKDIASIKLISDNNLGLVINHQNEVREKMDEILKNPSQIAVFSENARNYASSYFNIEKNSLKFKQLIENIIHED